MLGFNKKQKHKKKLNHELNWSSDIQEPTITMPLGMDNNFV